MKNLYSAKILIVKLDHIGDLLLATPVFKAIKEKYPECRLDVIANSKSSIVLKNNPYITHIYPYDSQMFNREGNNSVLTSLRNFETVCAIQHERYDICIGLREDHENLPLMKLLGAESNISFSTYTEYAFLLDKSVENDSNKHAAEINFDLLKLLNIQKPRILEPQIFTEEADEKWADTFLAENNISEDNIVIAISPGGGWFLNWWPWEKYASVCEMLSLYKPNIRIVTVGGRAEEKLDLKIRQNAKCYIASAVGKTTIHQLAALYRRAAFTITNDGGPMHICTAVGTPVIALFGPSPYNRFGPLGENNVILTKKFKCSPCPQFVKGRIPDCMDNRCMKAITVEEVLDVAYKKINQLKTG